MEHELISMLRGFKDAYGGMERARDIMLQMGPDGRQQADYCTHIMDEITDGLDGMLMAVRHNLGEESADILRALR